MNILFTMFGLIIAVIIFLYFLSAADSGKRKFQELRLAVTVPRNGITAKNSNQVPENQAGIKSVITRRKASQLDDSLKDMLPHRTCPLCRSELSRDEPLYAHNMEYYGKRTILIYGCPYCYKEEKKHRA